MDVRCPGCGFAASEWAALCPQCRNSLDQERVGDPVDCTAPSGRIVGVGEVSAPESVGEGETPYRSSPAEDAGVIRAGRHGQGGRVLGWLLVACVVVVGAIGVSAAVRRARREVPHRADALPEVLTRERLILSGPGFVGEYTADGLLVGRLPVPDAGAARFVTHGSTVAFVSGGSAFTADLSRPDPPLGRPGVSVFSGPDGSTGVVGPGAGTRHVGYVSAGGKPVPSSVAPPGLPAGVTAVVGLPTGVLGSIPVVAPTAFVDFEPAMRLKLYTTDQVLDIGTVSGVVATSDGTIAIVACAGDGSDCRMALVDPVSRRYRPITFPAGYRATSSVEGAFSPDGRLLAAFVISSPANGDSSVRAVVIDVATGRVRLVEQDLPVAAQSARAAWSGDGDWLFLQVGGGPVLAQEIGGGKPVGALWPLRLDATRLVGAV